MRDVLYAVIPAYNEEANIENVTRHWYKVITATGSGSRLVIIDDGSTDSTYTILCRLKEELPQLIAITKENSGHGSTVRYGYKLSIDNGADYVFQTDSDGQTLPEEFPGFWNDRHSYSAIIGKRIHRQDGLSRIIVTRVLKLILLIIFHVSIPDANTPFRLIDGKVLKKYLKKIPEDFNLSNVLLSVLLKKGNEKIDFRPVTFRKRQGGENSINVKRIIKIGINSIRDFRRLKKSI